MYYHATFAFWTLKNFLWMTKAPKECEDDPLTFLKLVYYVTMIIGSNPTIAVLFFAVILALSLPFYLYTEVRKAWLDY